MALGMTIRLFLPGSSLREHWAEETMVAASGILRGTYHWTMRNKSVRDYSIAHTLEGAGEDFMLVKKLTWR